MDECFFAAWAAAEVCIKPWNIDSQGKEMEKMNDRDEFSTWVIKFQAAMKEKEKDKTEE